MNILQQKSAINAIKRDKTVLEMMRLLINNLSVPTLNSITIVLSHITRIRKSLPRWNVKSSEDVLYSLIENLDPSISKLFFMYLLYDSLVIVTSVQCVLRVENFVDVQIAHLR